MARWLRVHVRRSLQSLLRCAKIYETSGDVADMRSLVAVTRRLHADGSRERDERAGRERKESRV